MSTRLTHDALPYDIPRSVRSALLPFDPRQDPPPPRAHGVSTVVVGTPRNVNEVAEIPVFKYEKLPTSTKRIRLLRLFAGVLRNPEIDCEMFEVDFIKDIKTGSYSVKRVVVGPDTENYASESLTYEALSWRWGDESKGEYAVMIRKGGVMYRKQVSETLGLALKYLRFEKDRYLWIDALCINQADYDERSSQVALMAQVYNRADKACVWLGEDDEDSTMAIKFIREEITQLKNFDRLCTDKEHAKKWRSLLSLMQRSWFSRRWVVQEIVLSKKATVYCGPDKIEWPELAIAVELFVEVETATHRLSELMKKDEKVDLIPNWFEHISELGASLLVNATAKVYRESELNQHNNYRSHGKIESRRSLLSLEYLVTSLSIFDCGRPHDSIYALVAIARDASPVAPSTAAKTDQQALVVDLCSHFLEEKSYILDYNRSYPDVCKDFVQFCIERCASIDRIQALDILCRPWAKEWVLPVQLTLKNPSEEVKPTKQRMMPSKEESWPIKVNVRKLRKLFEQVDTKDAKDRTTLQKSLGLEKCERPADSENADDERMFFDSRNTEEYMAHSAREYPVNDIIKQWFPDDKTAEDQKKRLLDAGKKEPPKPSTKKTRPQKNKDDSHALPKTTVDQILRTPPPEHDLGLPSWVARITAAPFDIFAHPGMDMVKMGRKNADPLVGVPQDGHRNYSAGQTKKIDLRSVKFMKRRRCNHYSMYTKGFWLDTVTHVAQVSQGGAIPAEWLALAGWSDASTYWRQNDTLDDPPAELWRTLVADRGMYDRNPPYYYSRACKETILKGGLKSGAVDTTALIHNERNSIVAEFCRRVQAVIWNRALIRTANGHLGLVENKVKKGDRVCILYGCTVPVILRKNCWKTGEDVRQERFEDRVETLKKVIRNCEENRAKKARWYHFKEKPNKDEKEIKKLTDVPAKTEKYNEKAAKVAEVAQAAAEEVLREAEAAQVEAETAQAAAEKALSEAKVAAEKAAAEKAAAEKAAAEKAASEKAAAEKAAAEKVAIEKDAAEADQAAAEDALREAETVEAAAEADQVAAERARREAMAAAERAAAEKASAEEVAAKKAVAEKAAAEKAAAEEAAAVAEAITNDAAEAVKAAEKKYKKAKNRAENAKAARDHKRQVHDYEADDDGKDPSDCETEDITDPESDSEDDKPQDGINGVSSNPVETQSQCQSRTEIGRANVETVSPPLQDVTSASQDNNGQQGKSPPKNKFKNRQEKAFRRDVFSHYEFLGGAYIHGMMDGEAVRQNFYNMKPDHIFEIR